MAKKLKDNRDLVNDLMTFSPYGALSQMFIIEAIRRYCKQMEQYEVTEKDDRSLVDMNAWKGCAADIDKRMNDFYDRQNGRK